MARVLLVHGSCFGGWVWGPLIAALGPRGHCIRTIDLPGRDGADVGLDDLAQAITDTLDGPTVLIGHSAAGYAITAAAEAKPDLVAGLIHIAAYVPQPGKSLADLRRAGPAQPMRGAFRLTPDRRAYGFVPERCADLFFHDCPDPGGLIALMDLEPIRPQETAFGSLLHSPRLPRAAVICTEDRAIPPAWQRDMAAGLVQIDLPSGHCPFLSMPDRLAETLHRRLVDMENATPSVAP